MKNGISRALFDKQQNTFHAHCCTDKSTGNIALFMSHYEKDLCYLVNTSGEKKEKKTTCCNVKRVTSLLKCHTKTVFE